MVKDLAGGTCWTCIDFTWLIQFGRQWLPNFKIPALFARQKIITEAGKSNNGKRISPGILVKKEE